MSNITSGGIIGLGSRLFLRKEGTDSWGAKASAQAIGTWKAYNIYNQAGSRPQKTTTPIEVSQLYPSAVRRKTILSTSSVAGSFVFSIPKEKSSDFWELITGDTGGDSQYQGTITALINNDGTHGGVADTGSFLAITTNIDENANSADDLAGNEISISGVKTEFSGYTDLPGTGGEAILVGDLTQEDDTTFQIKKTNGGNESFKIDFTTQMPSSIEIGTEITISGVTQANSGASTSALVTALNATHTVTAVQSGTDGVVTLGAYVADENIATASANAEIKISWAGEDDSELGNINTTHRIKSSAGTTTSKFALETEFDLDTLQGTPIFTGGASAVKVLSDSWSLQETNNTSFSFLQTQGLSYLSRYDGMMAQSATISVSPDDVANVDITFVGKDEIVAPVSDANLAQAFEGNYTDNGGTNWYTDELKGTANNTPSALTNNPFDLSSDGKSITKLDSTQVAHFDNFVDYYPSYNASLYVAKKAITVGGADGSLQTPEFSYSDGTNAWNNGSTGDWGTGYTAPHQNFLVPFADLSITVNNNLDFPTYINGRKTNTQPIQTTYKEVTVSMTLPYNKYTELLARDVFGNDSFALKLHLDSSVDGGKTSLMFEMPEVCVTGDGGLGDIPEGEITIPLTLTAYAPTETKSSSGDGDLAYTSISDRSPFKIYADTDASA